jgi:hypothetical protein
MRMTFPLLLALWLPAAFGQTASQTMYKCVDRDKRVTYSNITCEKQGLVNSGVVVERTMTLPTAPAQDLKPKPKPAPEPEKPAAQVVEPKVPQTKDNPDGMPALPTVKPPVK